MNNPKKVLIISSSPRKGNTQALCEQFARGAEEAGHQTELIRLADYRVGFCTACGRCNSHPGECSVKDDTAVIMHKMLAADVIVLATPAYFYTMSAQLKALIDRSCPYYLDMGGKDFYYLVAAFDPDPAHLQPVITALRGFSLDCVPNTREKGMVIAPGVTDVGDIESTPYLKQAYELGRQV